MSSTNMQKLSFCTSYGLYTCTDTLTTLAREIRN